ncbi:MAG: tetratricopeptide repeat protein [Bacteroidetes bacterium]|nr:MAG: tetratricopeptide repeat protein [Bacteroidota bacterium]
MSSEAEKPLIFLAHFLAPQARQQVGIKSSEQVNQLFAANVSRGECEVVFFAENVRRLDLPRPDSADARRLSILHLSADDWSQVAFPNAGQPLADGWETWVQKICRYPLRLICIEGAPPVELLQAMQQQQLPPVVMGQHESLRQFYIQLAKGFSIKQAIEHVSSVSAFEVKYCDTLDSAEATNFLQHKQQLIFWTPGGASQHLSWKIRRKFVMNINERAADKEATSAASFSSMVRKSVARNYVRIGLPALLVLLLLAVAWFTPLRSMLAEAWNTNACPFPSGNQHYNILLVPFHDTENCHQKNNAYHRKLSNWLHEYASREGIAIETGLQSSLRCPLPPEMGTELANSCRADLVLWGTYSSSGSDSSLSLHIATADRYGERAVFPGNTTSIQLQLSSFRLSQLEEAIYPILNWGQAMAHFQNREYELAIHFFERMHIENPEVQTSVSLILAQCYKNLYKYEAAAQLISQLLQRYPHRADLWAERAQILMEQDQYELALQDLRHAAELDSLNLDIFVKRGSLYGKMGRYEKALADFDYVLSLNPQKAAVYRERARIRLAQGDIQAALQDLQQALEVEPENALLYLDLADIQLRQGQQEHALQSADKALELNEKLYEACLTKARIYTAMQDAQQALAQYEKALRLNPSYLQAYQERAGLYEQQQLYKQALADYSQILLIRPEYLPAAEKRIQLELATGQLGQALKHANALLEQHPGMATAYTLRGTILYSMGEKDQAQKDFDQAIKLAPNEPMPYLYRARLLASEQAYEQALADLSHALQLNDTLHEALLIRARIYQAQQLHEQAQTDLDRAVSLAPRHAETWFERGKMAFEQKRFEQAIKDLSQCLELRPFYTQAYLLRAKAYVQTGEFDKAIADYDHIPLHHNLQAQQLAEHLRFWLSFHQYEKAWEKLQGLDSATRAQPEILFLEAKTLGGLGRDSAALASYSRAIQHAPDSASFYSGRGNFYLQRRKYTAAYNDFQLAMEIDPTELNAHLGLARVLQHRDAFEEALALYKRALELQPHDPRIYTYRAALYASMQEVELALADLDKALQINPFYAPAHHAKGNLLRQQGKYAAAMHHYDKALQLSPWLADAYYDRAFLYSLQAHYIQAAKDLEQAVKFDPNDGLKYGLLAKVYARLGREEACYQNILKALERKYPLIDIRYDPAFERYRNTQRFQEIVQMYQR